MPEIIKTALLPIWWATENERPSPSCQAKRYLLHFSQLYFCFLIAPKASEEGACILAEMDDCCVIGDRDCSVCGDDNAIDLVTVMK